MMRRSKNSIVCVASCIAALVPAFCEPGRGQLHIELHIQSTFLPRRITTVQESEEELNKLLLEGLSIVFVVTFVYVWTDCLLTVVVPRPTQPSIPTESLNEDYLRLGRQRQVCSLAWFLDNACHIGALSLRGSPHEEALYHLSSAFTFNLYLYAR